MMDSDMWSGAQAQEAASQLIHKYFTTQNIPLTKHHIDSYDQFIQRDLQNIIASNNPIINLKDQFKESGIYKYKVEIYIGGVDGSKINIGVPTVRLNNEKDVRLLFPNEARLRNLTYALPVQSDIYYRITIRADEKDETPQIIENTVESYPLCNIPLMLHSRYCTLHGKPQTVLESMGECPEDAGGYFIVDGAEKVLITKQEGAFNTLYISEQKHDKNIEYYATIQSLNPYTRDIKRSSFLWTRERQTTGSKKSVNVFPSVLEVKLPQVIKPVPIFILFRALGIQSDRDIMNLIFPDLNGPDATYMANLLEPSMSAAQPIIDTYSAITYIKYFTKGFSEVRVFDILKNDFFCHIDSEDMPAKAAYLAHCVRSILRVVKKLDLVTDKDDTRNQRLLTSGFLTQTLFHAIYNTWIKTMSRAIDEEYNYHKKQYEGDNFKNLFAPGNLPLILKAGFINEGIMRGFKGKWITGAGPVGGGDEAAGVIQSLSRLSYLDFMSHCRRVVLEFDTSMKLPGPRRLHPSQFGYFCTSETPTGGHIGITKNMSILTSISNGMFPTKINAWLRTRGGVITTGEMTPQMIIKSIPVFVNNSIVGYTETPELLARVLKALKGTGCLPPYSSNGFNRRGRFIFIYTDEGRPLRPLYRVPLVNMNILTQAKTWRDIVVGSLPETETVNIPSVQFIDPFTAEEKPTLQSYIDKLEKHMGMVEYVDPYEHNECYIANMPEHIKYKVQTDPAAQPIPETTHMEIHASSLLGLLGVMIPYANHNQSPRNQLSGSQSKQGISMYATNWHNRYDNNTHVLCYGEAPLARTLYQDYIGSGRMGYGQNIIVAMQINSGYNQEDGILINKSALERGLFRNITYRSYEAFEEDDPQAKTKIRIGNPTQTPAWLDLNIAYDYSKLDANGIIKEGEYVDETTVIVGRYMQSEGGIKDASVTPQVWTSGRVDEVVVLVGNNGLRIVKIRVVQDRTPELGDKFSNRHGQKGTIGMMLRAHDMPRTVNGIVPDIIMNPHAIPSRMTIGQLLEQLIGKVASNIGAIGNATPFMNEGSPHEALGNVLEQIGPNMRIDEATQQMKSYGFDRTGNEILYDGISGKMIESVIFIGPFYGMRLKHMTEDKWNARGVGRKEQRTHQPTGGRGSQGGLKIGEMERDAIVAHGVGSFVRESMMERSDGTSFIVCNGCGTIPIYNESTDFYLCSLCDGPVQYVGNSASTLEPIAPAKRSATTFSKVEMPYASKLFIQELDTFLNMGVRLLTTKDVERLPVISDIEEITSITAESLDIDLPMRVNAEILVPEIRKVDEELSAISEIKEQVAELEKRQGEIMEEEKRLQNERNAITSGLLIPGQHLIQPVQPLNTNQFQQQPQEQPIQPIQTIQTIQTNTIVQQPQEQIDIGFGPGMDIIPGKLGEGNNATLFIDTTDKALELEGIVQPNTMSAPLGSPLQPIQAINEQQVELTRPVRRFKKPSISQTPHTGGFEEDYDIPAPAPVQAEPVESAVDEGEYRVIKLQ